jgi:putative mRNA 3-end processing factor
MKKSQLIEFTDRGLYCRQADVYIDPWQPVDRAIITHGHSDHARWGMKSYLAHHDSRHILKHRLGENILMQTLDYGEEITRNGVKISLHPAGHITGSAQVRLEYGGEVWVFTGDYKLEDDGLCTPFEPVKCHTFITECTFGLPIYKWQLQAEVFKNVNAWWRENREAGKTCIIMGYALGKAQRILTNLDLSIGDAYAHGAVHAMNEVYRQSGIELPPCERITIATDRNAMRGSMVIAPPSAFGTPWMRKFAPMSVAFASGWMAVRGAKKRKAVDKGVILSDHVDWPSLLQAVEATGAEKVFATHGYTSIFARYLNESGIEADEVRTDYGGDDDDGTAEPVETSLPEGTD